MLKTNFFITAAIAVMTLNGSHLFACPDTQTPTLEVPECPLAEGSLQVASEKCYPNWSRLDHAAAYEQLQAIAQLWEKSGRSEKFLVYGKHNFENNNSFNWEIVPFYATKNRFSRFAQQLSVLWNIAFGSAPLSEEERELIYEFYAQALESANSEPLEDPDLDDDETLDVFCDADIIEKQWVLEGDKVTVLYNYAPIGCGDEHLHFMVIPKAHRLNFRYITEEEAVEAAEITQKLINHFGSTRSLYEVHLYHKNGGIDVGQTVPHWHQHVVFVSTATDSTIGKLNVFKNMLVGPFPLSSENLGLRVAEYRKELEGLKPLSDSEEQLPEEEDDVPLEDDENTPDDDLNDDQVKEDDDESFPEDELLNSPPSEDESVPLEEAV